MTTRIFGNLGKVDIMTDITALGEILIDFTPYGKAEDGCALFGRNPGGAPANLLSAVSKFGGKTAFIGKVGRDMFGDFLIKVLDENGIDRSGVVQDDEHNTTLAFVALDDSGDRSFSFYRNFCADGFLRPEEINASLIKNSKIFHFGSISLTKEPAKSATDFALAAAKEGGCIISYDPNYRPLLWESEKEAEETIKKYVSFADIIKVSKEEAEMVTGIGEKAAAAKKIFEMGPKIVLITDGGDGVEYFCAHGSGHVPSLKVDTVDTTGAGDIFFGTFLFEVLKSGKNPKDMKKDEVEACVKKAVRLSGLSTLKKGGIPSIPEYDA